MSISATQVKELRDATGAGMMDCKRALVEKDGNFDEAVKYLREKGMAKAAKRAGKTAAEGAVASYIHMGGKIGVLVEVNCETDFVARTETFQDFCKQVAMHIAAAAPEYVTIEEVPEARVSEEKEVLFSQLADSNKPENIKEKIVEGRLAKFYSEICLLEQEWIHDAEVGKVSDAVTAAIAKVGENIIINRFARFQIGG